MAKRDEPGIDVDCIFQCQTQKAYCVRMNESSQKDIWLPKSMVSLTGNQKRGSVVGIHGPEEFLTEKGMT